MQYPNLLVLAIGIVACIKKTQYCTLITKRAMQLSPSIGL